MGASHYDLGAAMSRRLILVLLLVIQISLVGWIGWKACPNKTEVGHMGAVVYFWRTLHFDVFHVNPPLTRMLCGLPVILCDPEYDWGCYSSRPQDRSEWAMGRAFIAANSPGKIRWCFAAARWSLIPLLLLGGWFGYRLSREMYGEPAAFVFLILWCSSPLVLAWGATICPDVVAAALGIVAVYAFRQWLREPSWARAAIAGVCLGLLPLTKLTWIIAFAIWPIIWCLWTLPLYLTKAHHRSLPLPRLRQLAAVFVLGLYTLNMGYLFDGTFLPLGKYTFISQLFRGRESPENSPTSVAQNRFTGTWIGVFPVPLPAEFVQGMDTQRYDFERGLPSYLRGEWADHGWWYYYLYALMIKEPLGTWCLVVLAVAATVLRSGYSTSWRDEMSILLPIIVILVFVSSQTGFSVHSRYVIPVMPFLFVWTSKVARVFEMRPCTRGRLVVAAVIVMMLGWSVGSSLVIYPHSLSYFNELAAVLPTPSDMSYPRAVARSGVPPSLLSAVAGVINTGPRNGPRHLLGSNVDWGQDLFYLEDWYESHTEARPIKVAYGGSYPLDQTKVQSAGHPPIGVASAEFVGGMDQATLGPMPGWYALSVNEILGQSRQYHYFLYFHPVAMAGYSIYIYHITPEEANRVRRELGLRELARITEASDHRAGR
jgi:hypothetical protein